MIYSDVTCPVCGCGCDDLVVHVEKGNIKEIENCCILGEVKFRNLLGEGRVVKPLKRKEGKLAETSFNTAIKNAADILSNADAPLIYGFSETSCEAIKVGIYIAEKTRGFIDSQSSHCHGPTILAEQRQGLSSCTLGMVFNHADVVLYWGCNPEESHPRHMSHYGVFPRGIYREEGRRNRKTIVVDTRHTETAKVANKFIQVKPDSDFELTTALRIALAGGSLSVDEVGGVSRGDIEGLAKTLRNCEYGVIFIGLGLTHSKSRANTIENLFMLVRELNRYTRCSVIPMRGHYNVAGFNQVLTWRTGYPFAVDFFRGYPRYNPGESSVIDVLSDKVVDAMLVVSADPVSHFPRKCVEYMADIPVVTLDFKRTPTTELSEVVLPGVVTGIESEGSYYRMDNVPLTAKKILDPPFKETLSDAETLKKIYEKL